MRDVVISRIQTLTILSDDKSFTCCSVLDDVGYFFIYAISRKSQVATGTGTCFRLKRKLQENLFNKPKY